MTTPPNQDLATEPAVQPAPARELHLRDYWRVVWHSRLLVAGVFLVVVGITAAWTLTRTPIYRATAIVEVQTQANNIRMGQDVTGIGAAGYGWFAEEKYHNTQIEIIKSREIAERVVNSLGLRSHPRFELAHDPIDAFRKSLIVEPRRETGLIMISLAGANREEITHWANEVARAYEQRNIDVAEDNVNRAVGLIQNQVDSMKETLRATEEQRLKALRDNELFSAEDQKDITRQNLMAWHTKLTEVEISKSEVGEQLNQIRDLQLNGGDLMTIPALAKDDTLVVLSRTRFELAGELEKAKVSVKPGHPIYQQLSSEVAKNKELIDERVALIFSSLRNQYENLANQERYFITKIDEAEQFSFRVAEANSGYETIAREADSQKKVFDLMSRAMNEVLVQANMVTNNVQVLDEAVVPQWPIAPRKKVNLAIGGIFGLFLGIGAAFFRDYLDNTFRTPEDIEKHLSLSVLGVIPKFEDGNDSAQRAIKEAYQSLRTSIIFSSKNRTRKIILVTSTGPQEGKSSTVANLGRTLAQAGDRAIILDCDLRRPTQHLHHDMDRDHGLTNYLTGREDETDWSGYIKRDEETGLEILTCGPIPPSPAELLGSERFKNMLEQLRESHDWVLIDSPPASSLADSTLLAAAADMVVAVVRHNKTDRDLVRKSVGRVRATGAHFAGAVLNSVDIHRATDKDYYYASYYYYGAEEGDKKAKKKAAGKREVG